MARGEKTAEIIARLREPSTWAGLSGLLVLLGVNVEAVQAVAQVGAGIAALAAVIVREGA